MKKGFTIIEVVVSIGILAVIVSFAGVVFKVSIESQRMAAANAEIMQKFRAITDQLNSDFKGLRKDGEIFLACVLPRDPDPEFGWMRFDRIFFFANGDFHTYNLVTERNLNQKIVRGNTAWICYTIARKPGPPPTKPQFFSTLDDTEQGRRHRDFERRQRVLARVQHVLTADTSLFQTILQPPSFFNEEDWRRWSNIYEYERTSLEQWKNLDFETKRELLTAATDIVIDRGNQILNNGPGPVVDPADPNMLLCEGVSQFMIQGWSDKYNRWIPETDWDGDGDLTNGTDFALVGSVPNTDVTIGVWYPYRPDRPYAYVHVGDLINGTGVFTENDPNLQSLLTEENFDKIPCLGRALKFTFTLYDSKGVIEGGRTLSHIVYLDN